MKVLQVIDSLNVGGAERVFVDLSNSLATSEVSVEVLLLTGGGQLEYLLNKDISVHRLHRTNKYALKSAFKAHKLFKKFDIVHVHMRHCYAYVRAVQLLFAGNYRVILHDHYGDIAVDKEVPFKLRFALRPRFYIGVSQDLTDWAKESLKVKKVFLLPNTIFPLPTPAHTYFANNRAIVVANIRPTKNIEFAIDLCNKLGIGLDIYGNKIDVAYFEFLKEKITDHAHISIIEGITDFSTLYHKYKFALHTARSETGPLVLLEYMAYGLPFVSYKTGEVANKAAKELPMFFVEDFNIETWVERVREVLRSDDMSAKLHDIFRRKFNSDNYLTQCLQIYQDVSC